MFSTNNANDISQLIINRPGRAKLTFNFQSPGFSEFHELKINGKDVNDKINPEVMAYCKFYLETIRQNAMPTNTQGYGYDVLLILKKAALEHKDLKSFIEMISYYNIPSLVYKKLTVSSVSGGISFDSNATKGSLVVSFFDREHHEITLSKEDIYQGLEKTLNEYQWTIQKDGYSFGIISTPMRHGFFLGICDKENWYCPVVILGSNTFTVPVADENEENQAVQSPISPRVVARQFDNSQFGKSPNSGLSGGFQVSGFQRSGPAGSKF